MDDLVNVLFAFLSGVACALFAANVALIALKMTHRRKQARAIAVRVAPYASYFRLGVLSASDRERSKHA